MFLERILCCFINDAVGVKLIDLYNVDNVCWESDYPHIAATYPRSWSFVEESLVGVPEEERKKMCYGNALRLYGLA